VKVDAPASKVLISVSGPSAARRRNLLAIIRSDFEHIHRDIPRLDPQEMVPVPEYPSVVIAHKKLSVLEENGVNELIEVIGETVVKLNVAELLNGIDLRVARTRSPKGHSERTPAEATAPIGLFYSYSHKDEHLRNELETHLKLLVRQQVIAPWHDRMIGAGPEWRGRISEYLEAAGIILLLVSADFINSDYCFDVEMNRALERHQAGLARVIPVIIRDVDWSSAPFGELQALPRDGNAVTLWHDRDAAWRNVAVEIKAAAEEIRQMRL
jgi:internalin A